MTAQRCREVNTFDTLWGGNRQEVGTDYQGIRKGRTENGAEMPQVSVGQRQRGRLEEQVRQGCVLGGGVWGLESRLILRSAEAGRLLMAWRMCVGVRGISDT